MISRRTGQLFLAMFGGLLPLIALVGLLSGRPAVVESTRLQEQIPTTAQIKNLSIEQGQLRFTLITPPPSPDKSGNLSVDGLQENFDIPYRPELPYYTTLIILPPEAEARITVVSREISHIYQPGLATAPLQKLAPYVPLDDSFAFPEAVVLEEESFSHAVSKNQFFPDALYEISDPMYMRDLRLVRLKVFPFRYNDYTDQLAYAPELDILVDFVGADLANRRPLPDPINQTASGLESQMINYGQAEAWRSLPASMVTATIKLPTGQPVYKIGVNQDGIYEVTAEQLAGAGMVVGVDGVDPHTFQMLYRGEPVAYELIDNGDNVFDPGERVRFYGWAFDGSRLERQFISENVFWLWADGDPALVTSKPSVPGTDVDYVRHSITEEQENLWFPGWTNRWEFFPNEPDAWFWHRFYTSNEPITKSFVITLEHPMENGLPATITTEFSSYTSINHTASLMVNGQALLGSSTWYGTQNVNITRSVPSEYLHDGINSIEISVSSNSSNCGGCIALNRITIEYDRELIVVDDQIIFSDTDGGSRKFNVGGFSKELITDTLIWDITDRFAPIVISPETIVITGTGPHTVTFGTDSPSVVSFIVATSESILLPIGLTRYVPPDLDPFTGKAEWVAISYEDFITETYRLAGHRSSAQFGGLTTHVVDIEDVVNQYGYGLPIPAAIQQYMIHGMEYWGVAPRYLLLVGDSTVDPRHHYSRWVDKQYIMTDLIFEDYWQGQIPSDHTFSLLVGDDDDLMPDIAVGRISVMQESDMRNIVDRITIYESNHLLSSGWMENFLYVADKDDIHAGNFCDESKFTGDRLPTSINSTFLCLGDYNLDADLLRKDLFTLTNNFNGVSLLNYRGHGGVKFWANILNTGDMGLWDNAIRPFVSISGDCLDGNFAIPYLPGLGEELLKATDSIGNPIGAAAHWGSTGLGTSPNHSRLIDAFYHALFVDGQTAIGEAAVAAKISYGSDPRSDPTLLSSFTLLGDPAMQLFRRSLSVEQSVAPQTALVGDIVTYTIEATNQGIYPSHITISHTLPTGFSFITATSSVSASLQLAGNGVIFDLQFGESEKDKGLPRNGSATLWVKVEILSGASIGESAAIAMLTGTGLEAWPGDETSEATVLVVKPSVYMPLIVR